MAAASSSSSSSVIFRGGLSSSPHTNFTHGRRNHNGFFCLTFPRSSVILPRVPITLTLARRKNSNSPVPSNKKKKTKKRLPENDDAGGERFDDDAVEALFDQLEEDLKNDLGSDDGDDEISEEDLARLEQELAEAFGISAAGENEDNTDNDIEDEDEDEEEEDEDEDEEEEGTLPKLKNWQLRQLAYALKIGRRKTSIKNLAAEVCLDRAVVLQILREPPPELVLLSAALPDKIEPPTSEAETKPMETMTEPIEDVVEPESQVKLPVHAMQSRWSMQKRLKKVQIETLERVYLRSKRPTNAMVSSIVHVTNLPRKRVVQWFEEKRAEEGVPNQRTPYKRSSPETMITN